MTPLMAILDNPWQVRGQVSGAGEGQGLGERGGQEDSLRQERQGVGRIGEQ